MIHGDNDYTAVRASKKRSHPGGGVESPERDAIAFANFARAEFTGKTVGGVGEIQISSADHTVAVGLGEGGFLAEPREIRQVISNARSLHIASVTHLATWVNGTHADCPKSPCAARGGSHKIPPFSITSFLRSVILLWPTDSFAGLVSPARRDRPMSFVAWKILRKLPKPLLLVILIFVLAAAARA